MADVTLRTWWQRRPRQTRLAAVGAVCIVVAVVALLISGGSSGGPESVRATPAPLAGPLSGPIDNGFVRRMLRPGEIPPDDHDILFVDVASGEAEFWNVPLDAQDVAETPWLYYNVDASHRWLQVSMVARPDPVTIIADRKTGRSYQFDNESWRVAGGPTAEGIVTLQAGGEFFVVDLVDAPTSAISRFILPGAKFGSAALLGSKERLAVAGRIVDLKSAEVAVFAEGDRVDETFAVSDGGAVAVDVDASKPGAAEIVAWRFDASGGLVREQRFPFGVLKAGGTVLASPDGRWLAWQASLPQRSAPMDDFWPVVMLADLESGRVVLRGVRMAMSVGFRGCNGSATARAWWSIRRRDSAYCGLMARLWPWEAHRGGGKAEPYPYPS
jgi:hypothetical protein